MQRHPLFSLLPLLLLFLFPFILGPVFATAMIKLHLSPGVALLVVIGILLGSAVNIPLKRILRSEPVTTVPWNVWQFFGWWPQTPQRQKETIIAVNVGGCLVPLAIALYETGHILLSGWNNTLALAMACAINTAVCYRIAQPVPGIGIAMPALIPPLVAVLAAMLLAPEARVPIAFVAGVMGPLLGADLLNLKRIPDIATGMASIGGAGTFDGIVLSGILAAYLA